MSVVAASGLDIVFDWSFDGGAWPGASEPSIGEAWLGPKGLLHRLELELGLLGLEIRPQERVVALARVLGDGYWSRSFEVDPIATAARLLEDRDALVMWGWRGKTGGARLASLWEATCSVPAGVPDRVCRVTESLARNATECRRITLLEPPEMHPPVWRDLFRTLERRGVAIVVEPREPSPAIGDLAIARTRSFEPHGDGTLQIFRPHGALAAADGVAAVLCAGSETPSVLVVGPDHVLDSALGRHGVPRLGAQIPPPASTGLLRACIEAAFHPMDAADLHALICADPGPVPRNVAWGLAGALRQFAGRGSTAWREAMSTQLGIVDPERRDEVAFRLACILEPIAPHDGALGVADLEKRVGALASWARGRGLGDLAVRCDQLVALTRGSIQVRRIELLRLCDTLERALVPSQRGEAGLHGIASPGAMAGPASTVIWWGFARDRSPRWSGIRLSREERGALGLAAPDAGALMALEARRCWLPPFQN